MGGELIRGGFRAPPIFKGKSPGDEVGEGLIRGVELIRGREAYTCVCVCVCVWGGGGGGAKINGLRAQV